MSDLELLQLVETVKEKQRGPAGPAGVGIERIEQFDATGFTFDSRMVRLKGSTSQLLRMGLLAQSGLLVSGRNRQPWTARS